MIRTLEFVCSECGEHFVPGEKLLGKNKLICYNIERVNIFCAAAGQQR